MYKNTLYLTLKLTALAAAIAIMEYENRADTQGGLNALCALAFCCLFLTDFLLSQRTGGPRTESVWKKRTVLICLSAETAGCLICGPSLYFPLLLMLLFQMIDQAGADSYFYPISAAAAVLAALIVEPSFFTGLVTIIMTALGAFGRYVAEKLERYRSLSEELRENISAQNEKISGLKGYLKTLRHTASLEERNRFSARIHDRLGHGISGSIILLEGVRLNVRNDPELAEKNLGAAIENLRGSVDSIRDALREERPKRSDAGITDFKEMLERFELTYGIKTELSIEGDTDKMPPQIWSCLKENLTEAMTNTVKHSNAGKFELRICIYNKIIRAEFSDDGGGGGFTKGMGLEAMEERTALYGGKCVCESDALGFKIINIFRI